MKKVISLFLSIVMLFCITAGIDLSIYAATSGDFEYEILEDGTAEITNYTGSSSDLTIPTDIDGYSVTSISKDAFRYCDSLTSVTIPNSVTSIGEGAFYGCISLTNINVASDNKCYSSQEGVLFNKNKTELIQYSIGNERTSYAIPDSVKNICNYAFDDGFNLTNITIPNSVTSIGEWAFEWCLRLTNVTIPNSVTSIGEGAFYSCHSLTSINVASDNKNYSSQDGVLFNKNKTNLIQYPISNVRISYAIPNSVTSIGNFAFSDCDILKSITIPNNVTKIGDVAFSDCDSLTSIIIPDSVISIGDAAFSDCVSLTDITFDNNVTSIGEGAFDRTAYYNDENNWDNGVLYINNALIKVTDDLSGSYEIKNGTTVLADYVFYYRYNLTSVTIPSSVTNIGESSFYGCDGLINITIPNSVTSIGNFAFDGCVSLTNINVASDNKCYSSQEGVLFNKNKTNLIQYPINNERTSYAIPDSVKRIDNDAFALCDTLKSVTINDNVTSIGHGAFYSCYNLTSITIGNSVTSIDEWAFSDCYSLIEVFYDGTMSEWNNIFIGMYNESLTNAAIHCNDGVINEKEHTHSFVTESTPSTCTDQGYTTYTCECGYSYIDNYVDATGHSWDSGKVTKSATCTATGVKTYTCTVCGAINTETIAKKAHTYKTATKKATISKNGSIVTKCSVCGSVSKNTVIYYPKTISLSTTSYTYNGKVKKPSVTVKDSKGKKISSKYYTVTYQSGRKNVGKYSVKITFKGNYSGSKILYFTINPKATALSSVTAKSKGFTVKWKKQTSQTTGYQLQYSTSSKFKSANTVTVSKNKTTAKTISKLKVKKKYYVRVRTYKTVKINGKSTKIYSSWSKVKSVTTKK